MKFILILATVAQAIKPDYNKYGLLNMQVAENTLESQAAMEER